MALMLRMLWLGMMQLWTSEKGARSIADAATCMVVLGPRLVVADLTSTRTMGRVIVVGVGEVTSVPRGSTVYVVTDTRKLLLLLLLLLILWCS